jgi:hypothetical protein
VNDEATGTAQLYPSVTSGTSRMAWIFPELRDVAGYFIAGTFHGSVVLEWSASTTNGVDGSWTTVTSSATTVAAASTKPGYRTVQSMSVSGAKAVRISVTTTAAGPGSVAAWHLFGKPTSGGDRLELWHPSLSQRVGGAHFDWGNAPQGSTGDVQFRVKNTSGSLTANTVTVSVEAPTDTSPSVSGQHTLSDNGVTFGATVSLGSLAPGAVSGVLTLRRATPSNAALGLWTFRVKAAAGSWT